MLLGLFMPLQSQKKGISIPPNALPRKIDPSWRGGFSSGAKLGLPRTSVALAKAFVLSSDFKLQWLAFLVVIYELFVHAADVLIGEFNGQISDY